MNKTVFINESDLTKYDEGNVVIASTERLDFEEVALDVPTLEVAPLDRLLVTIQKGGS